jgi:hypothetical protein
MVLHLGTGCGISGLYPGVPIATSAYSLANAKFLIRKGKKLRGLF